ncbi:MAG: beta-galactosidase, partial [Acidobacteria bacterium]|nr:beta-galactosidase [Acidobacteriota bacterium]
AKRRELLAGIVWPLHEPLMFLQRRGLATAEEQKDYWRYHTEANVRKIAATGVEIPRIVHFYKGFGIAAESEEMGRTADFIAQVHKLGMKAAVYIGGTMSAETFFLETPGARSWIRVDQHGQPVTYGNHQSARFFPCLNQPGYVDYLRKVLRKAVVEAKADRIFFDNFTLYSEPLSCHNEACVREFRRFLERKYDARGRVERFGFAQVEGIQPPLWNAMTQPWDVDVIQDPLLQEWVDFRCWTLANYYHQLAVYIKSLNPSVSVGVNVKGVMGRNRAFRDGVDFARLAGIGDWFELDPGYAAGISSTGSLVSEIRTYKLGQSLEMPFDFEATTELRMAEYMAFNHQKETAGFGMNGGFRELFMAAHRFRYFDFFKANDAPYYRDARSVADVAVLRSYSTMAHNGSTAQRSTVLAEQILIQNRVPFHIILDRQLEDLSKYKVLLLAGQEALSDEAIASIGAFVRAGGGLVATGAAGEFDGWYRQRRSNTLAQALGLHSRGTARGAYGKGRFALLGDITPSARPSNLIQPTNPPEPAEYFAPPG